MMPSHPPAQPARYDSTPALARTDHAPWRALRSPEAPQRSHTTCCCRVHTLLLSAPRTGCPSTRHRSLRMPTPTHNAMPPAQNTPPRTHLHRPHRIPRALSAQTPRLRRHPCLDTPSRTLWRLALHRPSASSRARSARARLRAHTRTVPTASHEPYRPKPPACVATPVWTRRYSLRHPRRRAGAHAHPRTHTAAPSTHQWLAAPQHRRTASRTQSRGVGVAPTAAGPRHTRTHAHTQPHPRNSTAHHRGRR
jgi:hypothetical protein